MDEFVDTFLENTGKVNFPLFGTFTKYNVFNLPGGYSFIITFIRFWMCIVLIFAQLLLFFSALVICFPGQLVYQPDLILVCNVEQ